MDSREAEIEYCRNHGIELPFSAADSYSRDRNLWHISHEGLELEDPANEPLYNKPGFLEMGVSPEMAPDKPTYVKIHFEQGVPTAIDGVEMDSVALVTKLNELGGANGIGLLDIVENRLVGIVTVDDAIDVLQEAATDDINMMAAITPSDKPYLKTYQFWHSRPLHRHWRTVGKSSYIWRIGCNAL